VFLTGIGYFDGSGFRVLQYFIRDLYEEASLLHDFAELLRHFPVVVSFNGRAFDWPMLYNRFILNGHRDLPEFTHWDLLTFSRRVWRNRLRDCSLGSLERNVLGVERFGDVPGYLIPQIYFDYLRTKDARPLRPVFSHNHEDIVSLARLADLLLAAENDPLRTLIHGVDQLSYGLHLLEIGEITTSEQLILPNLDVPEASPNLRARAYRTLAVCYRRQRRWADAVALWQRMNRQQWHDTDAVLYPIVELAKFYEHRQRDVSAALRLTEQALNIAALHGQDYALQDLNHRYARLVRKSMQTSPVNDEHIADSQGG
jgi:uncharacterized protein